MTVQHLASRDNPLLKKIRLISSGSNRAPRDLVLAEGIRVLEEVERARCEVIAIVLSDDFGTTAREKELVDLWKARDLRICSVAENLYKSISTVQSPQGAIAIVRVPFSSLEDIRLPESPLVLCACGIQDPGNLGTLIRSAVAAGCSMVCATKGTVSARNPKTIRSSAGSYFRIPVVEQTEPSAFLSYCARNSITVYRTDVHDGLSYTKVDLKSPSAVLLGNEAGGLDENEFVRFPRIRIPMSGEVESLNVAVAGALILFEAFRQRSAERS